jgi:site-specific recombinase XerD
MGLRQYFDSLRTYCGQSGVAWVRELTPAVLKDFLLQRTDGRGPELGKAIVWSLRKLGAWLTVMQWVEQDPARHLHHPQMSRRARLPQYLSAAQLRGVLQAAAGRIGNPPELCALGDFAILSVLATTGLRPHEVAALKPEHLRLEQHRADVPVKGGWIKKTPLSAQTVAVLEAYLKKRPPGAGKTLFLNRRGRPVTVWWIQRMVRAGGEQAGLDFRLTPRHLRHTFATHAADRHGKTITRALLGHRDTQATEVYTHLSPRRFRSLMNLHSYQSAVVPEGVLS